MLIAFGIFALVMGGIRYTDRDKVLDIGPMEAQSEQRETIPLSPIVGIASLAGGSRAGHRRRPDEVESVSGARRP